MATKRKAPSSPSSPSVPAVPAVPSVPADHQLYISNPSGPVLLTTGTPAEIDLCLSAVLEALRLAEPAQALIRTHGAKDPHTITHPIVKGTK